MKRLSFVLLLFVHFLLSAPALAQYPIYPALPQPPAPSFYAPYPSAPLLGLGSPYGYSVPLGNFNFLPPPPPSPYYVVPRGREYLEQIRRNEAATYAQLQLQHDLRK
jgi:hypothetical protein